MNIEINKKFRILTIDGEMKYRLSKKETDLLKVFIDNPNKTFSALELTKMVGSKNEKSVQQLIYNVKEKYPDIYELIETIHSKGYRWIGGDNNDNEKEV